MHEEHEPEPSQCLALMSVGVCESGQGVCAHVCVVVGHAIRVASDEQGKDKKNKS